MKQIVQKLREALESARDRNFAVQVVRHSGLTVVAVGTVIDPKIVEAGVAACHDHLVAREQIHSPDIMEAVRRTVILIYPDKIRTKFGERTMVADHYSPLGIPMNVGRIQGGKSVGIVFLEVLAALVVAECAVDGMARQYSISKSIQRSQEARGA